MMCLGMGLPSFPTPEKPSGEGGIFDMCIDRCIYRWVERKESRVLYKDMLSEQLTGPGFGAGLSVESCSLFHTYIMYSYGSWAWLAEFPSSTHSGRTG